MSSEMNKKQKTKKAVVDGEILNIPVDEYGIIDDKIPIKEAYGKHYIYEVNFSIDGADSEFVSRENILKYINNLKKLIRNPLIKPHTRFLCYARKNFDREVSLIWRVDLPSGNEELSFGHLYKEYYLDTSSIRNLT